MNDKTCEPKEPEVGDPVLISGEIVALLADGLAIVKLYRSWPQDQRVMVAVAGLDHNCRVATATGDDQEQGTPG